MKKATVLFAILILGFAFDAPAQEYKVGDKMPNYRQGDMHWFVRGKFGRIDYGPNCDVLAQTHFTNNFVEKYLVVFASRADGTMPYGIFDFGTKIFYLDNKAANEENGPDGLIDEIITNPANRGNKDHPYCNKK